MALRAYHETRWQTGLAMVPLGIFVLRLVSDALHSFVVAYAPSWAEKAIYDSPNGSSMTAPDGWVSFGHSILLVSVSFLVARRSAVGLASFFGIRSLMFERVQRWADLIGECAETARAPHMRVDLKGASLRFAELRVKGARSMRGTVPAFSRRRPELRTHANQVVAALRAARAEFDIDRKAAARKLAGLALKISDRYAQGHVGALLDSTELVAPARGREAFHLAVMASLTALAAVGVQAFHVPTPIAFGAVVLAGAWLYRSAVSAGLAVLPTLLPVLLSGK
ncbi:hypothetical protein [Streptomyces cucumeris]|uniref:hypothetical protein n=1 Tax=Streptomyces cucumeris TaxID=2962890 RepID=UPI003D70341C